MKPVFTIIAGANGCGKSTLTVTSREAFQLNSLLDPDAVAKSIHSGSDDGSTQLEAGRQVLLRAENLLAQQQSFTVETTLSGHTYVRMVTRARELGYTIVAILIGTESIEINLQRVRDRVAKGGHDIPEDVQRRRWPRVLANMQELVPLADQLIVLDNSQDDGYRLIAGGTKGSLSWFDPVPVWAVPLRDASRH